eukprot:797688-Rhodomonas_salina.1
MLSLRLPGDLRPPSPPVPRLPSCLPPPASASYLANLADYRELLLPSYLAGHREPDLRLDGVDHDRKVAARLAPRLGCVARALLQARAVSASSAC